MRRLSIILASFGLACLSTVPAAAQDDGASYPQPETASSPSQAQGRVPGGSGRRTEISPYIEIGQVLTDDFTTDDVLTYSTVAAGVDATISTRHAEGQVSYRYERRISYDKHVGDDDIHSGLARVAVGITPALSIEGGALATRARSDIRGAAAAVLAGNVGNISQVYAAYVGPTLGTHVGPIGASASYQYGYTKVEAPGFTDFGPNQPRLDNYDDSNSHVFQGSLNLKAGDVLPVGVTVSGAYDREDAGQLDQRYDGKYLRGDVLLPVSPTLALEAGVGYEKIQISQKDALVDTGGQPAVDDNGRFITDPNSPKRIAYNTDGLYYDAGVVWRPSPRTQLEAHVGKRYGDLSYAGSFSWAASQSVGVQVQVYDQVETFAHQLRTGLSNLPTSFISGNDAFGQQFSGCTFGTSGAAAGGCLNGIFQSISSAGYRARGVDAVLVATHGPVQAGFGLGYASRHFFAPDSGPDVTLYGVDDQSYYAQFFASRALDSRSSIEGNLYANYFESGLDNASGVYSTGATGSYNRTFGRLGATASLGIFAYDSDNFDKDVSAQAQIAMRYQF